MLVNHPTASIEAAPASIDTKRPAQGTGFLVGVVAVLIAIAGLLWIMVPWAHITQWAAQEQRAFQITMAGALRAIRGGDSLAILALCSATAAYGFVHALGPGHGKVLLGGAALATGATMRRMAVLTLLSSLGQAAMAIVIVAGLTQLLGWATKDLVAVAEAWLAPASAFAIAGIGGLLIVRGLRSWPKPKPTPKQHDHACGCGHSHGPSLPDVQNLSSTQDAALLIGSIAIRPRTGALFVLVIASAMNIFAIGCLAVVTMSLGTAAFNVLVAASGFAARRLVVLPLESSFLKGSTRPSCSTGFSTFLNHPCC